MSEDKKVCITGASGRHILVNEPHSMIWVSEVLLRHFGKPLAFDHSYAKSDLGLEFRPMEQTLTEHFQQLLDDGLVKRR